MKYVAFLDILGFKDILRTMDHDKAKDFIVSFSANIYSVWSEKTRDKIRGYVVSDSVIIYTTDLTNEALQQLLDILDQICKREFALNSILLRGAIAKGEFDKIEAQELSTLSKGLIVGQAYVDAYLLEGTVKTIGIVISKDVFSDIQQMNNYVTKVIEENGAIEVHYILKYLDIDFLLVDGNLNKYVSLAKKSSWLPHYYNTLYFSLKNETSDAKVSKVFSNILLEIHENKPSENWRLVDTFIKNAFDSNVNANFQTRFLKYIRTHLIG